MGKELSDLVMETCTKETIWTVSHQGTVSTTGKMEVTSKEASLMD